MAIMPPPQCRNHIDPDPKDLQNWMLTHARLA